MEVRRAIMVAQRQHQSTVASANSAGMESTTSADRKPPTSFKQGSSQNREKGPKDARSSRQSPLHTLESSNLPDEDPLPSDRSGFIFYSDDGGYRATDERDQEWRGGLGRKAVVDGKIVSQGEEKDAETGDGEGVIYYLGIIDILTTYTVIKRVEHFWKGLNADRVSLIFNSDLFSFLL